MKKSVILIFLFLLSLPLFCIPGLAMIEVEDPAGVNPQLASYLTYDVWLYNSSNQTISTKLDENYNDPTGQWGYPVGDKYLSINLTAFEGYGWEWQGKTLYIDITYNNGTEVLTKENITYSLTSNTLQVFEIANNEGIQFGIVETKSLGYGVNNTDQNYMFDYIAAPSTRAEDDVINVLIDPSLITVENAGNISITQYDRPANNIPNNLKAVPFGLKIEDNHFDYSDSPSFNVTFSWSDDVQLTSFVIDPNDAILVYSKDNGKLWTEHPTVPGNWTFHSVAGSYQNHVTFTITDFTPFYESTIEEPNPSLWAIGDKSMFDLDKVTTLSYDVSIQTSKYTESGVTHSFNLDWVDVTGASYYRIKECKDSQGTYNYDIPAPMYNYGTWTNSSDVPWTMKNSNAHAGSWCIESGDIGNNEFSQVSNGFDVYEDGIITFYYKVSSENSWDFLKFSINGINQDSWSGEVVWTQATYPVSAGPNVFTWSYVKDGASDDGSDCAWLDDIVFPESISDVGTINPVEDFENGAFNSWSSPAWNGDLLSDSQWECELSEDEYVSYYKVQGYNGLDNNGSLSDETFIVRRFPAPHGNTTSSFAFSFIGETEKILPSQISNLIGGNCDVIAQWSNTSQGWNSVGYISVDNEGWDDNSYEFEKSEPFILNSTDDLKDVFLVEAINMFTYVTPNYKIIVGAGSVILYTMVTVPYNTLVVNASALMTSIWTDGSSASSEITVSKLDQIQQIWKTYSYDGSGSGDDFVIYPGDVIKVGAVDAAASATTEFYWQE